jgi:hypothetical protein
LALAACDLGVRPLFALGYCSVRTGPDRLADQRARESDLRDRIHEAEMRLARLPVCASPRPTEPKKEARVVPPTPRPTPIPQPSPLPEPPERLKIPESLSELKGCWQAVRGDLQLYDSGTLRPFGKVRVCYCFDDNDRGTTRYVYQDGAKCTGPLQAQLSQNQLVITHPNIECNKSGHRVGTQEIVCTKKPGDDSAYCDHYILCGHNKPGDEPAACARYARIPTDLKDEKYHRVSLEYCK